MSETKFTHGLMGFRHGFKPNGGAENENKESKSYKGLSEKGVVEARKVARERILNIMKEADPSTIMLFLGASEQIRTNSTAEVFGDELADTVEKEKINDLMVINPVDIDGEKYDSQTERINSLLDLMDKNPDKKIVVNYPMFIKEFVLGKDRWLDEKGELSEYAKNNLERNKEHGDNKEEEALKTWIKEEGICEIDGKKIIGPNPIKVAEEHLQGFNRLIEFVNKTINNRSKSSKNRPIIINGIAHSWNLDVMAIYLANNKKVDMEGYERICGGKMIKPGEDLVIKIENDKAILDYRNNEFEIDLSNE
ncbi:MAG: hypothetical protein MUF50_03015 [Planctomycetes bacterium]|nr:hypothetical protein [Planctomycetota bacterium]